jgi:hypothetical protein
MPQSSLASTGTYHFGSVQFVRATRWRGCRRNSISSRSQKRCKRALDRFEFHEKVIFMNHTAYSTPAPLLPNAALQRQALFTSMPDWRGDFRLHVLDLNPDLRALATRAVSAEDLVAEAAPHWIMQDPVLARMIMSLQGEANTLGQWQVLCGGEALAATCPVLIEQLGFKTVPEPVSVLDNLRAMLRLSIACVGYSAKCYWQMMKLENSLRERAA